MTGRWRSVGHHDRVATLLLILCLAAAIRLPPVDAVTLAKPKRGHLLPKGEQPLPADKGEVGTTTESSSEEMIAKGWGAGPRAVDDGDDVWDEQMKRRFRQPVGPPKVVVASTTETSVTNAAIGAVTDSTETEEPPPPPPIKTTTEDYEAMMEEEEALEETFVNHTCYGKHIRYDVTALRHLRKCTTVAGNVVMVFLNFQNNIELLKSYSFPKLIEITGYLLIHNVRNAPSLSHMFPNLRVIRGAQLVHKYALVIVDNVELLEIAFPSLTTISHGYAIIRDNPNLCDMDAINWDRITVDTPGEEDGSNNVIAVAHHAHCPRRLKCAGCAEGYCWKEGQCQLFENGLNVDGNMHCHKHCIGGCVNETAAGCFRCRGMHINGTCVDECPEHLFRNDFIYGCSDADGCWFYNAIPLQGACYPECPAGFGHIVQPRLPKDMVNCHKCPDGRCLRVCRSGAVRWLSDLEQFRNCQVINGSVLLQLHETHKDQRPSLLRHFREVEQILGTLEVHRSSMLTDLSFFKRLHLIDPLQSELLNGRYAVKIWDNRAMTQLWDWSEHPVWNVTRGEVGIIDNPRLCARTIRESVAGQLVVADADALRSMNEEEIASNGYHGVCESRDFETRIVHVTADSATIQWAPFVPLEGQSVFAYYVYHTEAALQDANRDEGMDVCASKHWHSRLLPTRPDGTLIDTDRRIVQHDNWLSYNVTGLLQHQQYAYYVQVDVRRTNETSAQDIVQGLSTIAYFTTTTRIPLPPFVYTQSKTNTSISLRWFHPAWDTDRYVELYVVDVYRLPDNLTRILSERNYCDYPKVITPPRFSPIHAYNESVYKCCEQRHKTPRFLTAHIGLDGDPDACGPEDHECRRDAEYHILKSDDTYYSHNSARLAAIRAEELPYLQMPLPTQSPFNYRPQKRYIAIPHFDTTFVTTRKVSNYTRNLTVENLVPFERYAFRVYACTFQSQCGAFYQHFERTLRTPNADNVELTVELHDYTADQLMLHVQKPRWPTGGAVMSWEFVMYAGGKLSEKWCIDEAQMQRKFYRLIHKTSLKVNLVFQVRAVTLGSYGNWAEAFYIAHYDTMQTHEDFAFSLIIFIACFAVIGLCIIITGMYQHFKKTYKVADTPTGSMLALGDLNTASVVPTTPPAERRRAVSQETVTSTVNSTSSEETSFSYPPQPPSVQRVVDRAAGEGTSAQARAAAGEPSHNLGSDASRSSAVHRVVDHAAGEGTSAQARAVQAGVPVSQDNIPAAHIDLEAGRQRDLQQPGTSYQQNGPRAQQDLHHDMNMRYNRVAYHAVAAGYAAGNERARLIACNDIGQLLDVSSDDDDDY